MIKHFLNPPNWFTSASLFCSTYAMASLMGGEPSQQTIARASVLVIFAGIFDLLDGRVARLTGRFSEFGVQLDTIADVVGFGVAPAMIAWAWKLHELGPIGMAAAFWYVLAAAFRLARFNVNTVTHTWDFKGHSQGLTSTMSGGSLVTLVWVSNGYLAESIHPSAWLVAALLGALGLAMVSSIPFRNFKNLRQSKVARRMLAVSLAACLVGVSFDWSMWFGVGGALYLSIGLLDGIVVAVHHRRLRRALLLDEIEQIAEEGLPDDGDSEDDAELEVAR